MDIWVTIRVKLRWLWAAVIATEEQSMRDHAQAARAKDNAHQASELRVQADLQHEAHKGLKEAHKEIEDDHV